MSRELDLVLLGASGSVGTVMARYFRDHAPDMKWAIAGRKNSGTLKGIAMELASTATLITADCSDLESLRRMAARAKVVVTAVGPYSQYGEPVVAACIAEGAHYVDITGEMWWVSQMRSQYGLSAEAAGVCLCSFAGYDCVPFEMSTRICHNLLATAHGTRLVSAECLCTMTMGDGGGLPPGTMLTILNIAKDGVLSTCAGWLDFLPRSERLAALGSLVAWALPCWSVQAGGWTVPEGMGVASAAIVHFGAPRLGYPKLRFAARYAALPLPFQFLLPLGGGLSLWPGAFTLWGLLPVLAMYTSIAMLAPVALFGFVLIGICPPVARLVARFIAMVGAAGSPRARTLVTTRGRGANGAIVHSVMDVPGDAGVYATALLACETSLSLLDRLGAGNAISAGFVTPAVAVGIELEERLKASGVRMSVE